MNELQQEQVISSCGKDVLRFCRITAGCEGDDLYQDTMLTLLEKIDRLDPQQNIKSYAISIAIKLWENRRRKYARRLRLVPQQSLETLTEQGIEPGCPDTPEETLLRSTQEQMVRHLVEELPAKYRLPIQMFYSAQMSVQEIARTLHLPENTAKSRLHRGKEMLRKELEELDYDTAEI